MAADEGRPDRLGRVSETEDRPDTVDRFNAYRIFKDTDTGVDIDVISGRLVQPAVHPARRQPAGHRLGKVSHGATE